MTRHPRSSLWDTRRLRKIGEWLFAALIISAFWITFPVLRRWADSMPLPVATSIFATYVCISLFTDVIQCVDPESIVSRFTCKSAYRREVAAMTEAELRRKWFRGLARSNMLALLFAVTCVFVSMYYISSTRKVVLALIGEGWTTAIFGIAMFALLLVPMCTLTVLFALHPRYRCPNCGKFLSVPDSVKRLNRDATCNDCGQSVSIAPYSKRGQYFDCSWIVFGMVSLIVFISAWT